MQMRQITDVTMTPKIRPLVIEWGLKECQHADARYALPVLQSMCSYPGVVRRCLAAAAASGRTRQGEKKSPNAFHTWGKKFPRV